MERSWDTSERRRRIHRTLESLVEQYPEPLRPRLRADVARQTFHLSSIPEAPAKVADVAGGTWLIDDIADNGRFPLPDLGIHDASGVTVLEKRVEEWTDGVPDSTFDVVTCFEAVEHWHHNARASLAEAVRVIKPGGLFFLSAPNAVHAFNRILTLVGRSTWASLEDWYKAPEFRGHVREPTRRELVWIVGDLGLDLVQVWGRNFSGYLHAGIPAPMMRAADALLRRFPSLSMEVYVLARKPASAGSARSS